MAPRITQKFLAHGYEAVLSDRSITLECQDIYNLSEGKMRIMPKSKDEAHDLALMFRRMARRLEEIGKGMVG